MPKSQAGRHIQRRSCLVLWPDPTADFPIDPPKTLRILPRLFDRGAPLTLEKHPMPVVGEDDRHRHLRGSPMDMKKKRGVDDGDFALPDDEAEEFADEEEEFFDDDDSDDDDEDDLDDDDDVELDDEYDEEEYDEDEDLDLEGDEE
jgi:hypothetical protein